VPKPPDYGLIYNWDGNPHGYSEYPQSMEQFLDKVYAPMKDTQVGAHFWCVGEHTARWKSDVLETVGDFRDRVYESPQAFTFNENIIAMIERGEDPQAETITRGHELGMQVYGSVRMNDNHFGGAQPSDLSTMHNSELTRMRAEHPEWLLGDKTTPWFALSWNLEVPEARKHRFDHVEEVARRWDWDGIEVDWQRHGFHLPDDYGYRLRYVITDVQRAVRRVTNEIAEQRGRPYYLGVRVSGTPEMSYRIGYDVQAWIDEGLVDIIVPAGSAHTDPLIAVEQYLKMCEGTDVVVYPGFDSRVDGLDFTDFVGPEDAFTKDLMRTRAVASQWHAAGSDGIYLFNWHANGESRRELMKQVGSVDTLRRTDKIFAAGHRYKEAFGTVGQSWAGAFDNDRIWGQVPVPLKATLTLDGPTIDIDQADDLNADTPESIQLRVRIDQWVVGDVLRFYWDGEERADIQREYHIQEDAAGNPLGGRIHDVSSASWFLLDLTSAEATKGKHTVKVALEHRNPRVANDLVLTNVELVLRYGSDTTN
jgi:hypothetical protein